MRVAILGLGLIGGSVARALAATRSAGSAREHVGWSIAAWSPSGRGPAQALADGSIDRLAGDIAAAVEGAGLVVVAAPPLACLDLLDRLGALRLPPDAVVTDVASTKTRIVERAAERRLRFVGGHPMAGLETSGYASSHADLFVDRPWVVVPASDAEAGARVEELVLACRARPVPMSAAKHDALVAAVSHLPLVAAAALVEAVSGDGSAEAPDWEAARALAAGGWRDMTRLARGDAEMGAGIAATNAGPLAARLRAYRSVLDAWIVELERPGGPDPERLAARLREARRQAESSSS